MWRHLLTKFASYKVPPVMVSVNPWVRCASGNVYKNEPVWRIEYTATTSAKLCELVSIEKR